MNRDFSNNCVSETWLKDHNQDNYSLCGYNSEHNSRQSQAGEGGGVQLYIKDIMEDAVRNDPWYQNDIMETMFIEIGKDQFKKKQNIIIGVIYRPPDTDIHEFYDYILQCSDQIKAEKKVAYLLRNDNVNLLNVDNHTALSVHKSKLSKSHFRWET